MDFSKKFLDQTIDIATQIDADLVSNIVNEIVKVANRDGRIFFIGSGGGAGHASHAVNDFRKIAGIECYSPSDNVSELTARINDDGWENSYVHWLEVSRFSSNDAIFIFSVGGGDAKKGISENLIKCIDLAKENCSQIFGVVGRDGGYAKQSSELVIVIPTPDDSLVTPHVEGWQAVIWHLIVSHPDIQKNEMKWESENE